MAALSSPEPPARPLRFFSWLGVPDGSAGRVRVQAEHLGECVRASHHISPPQVSENAGLPRSPQQHPLPVCSWV